MKFQVFIIIAGLVLVASVLMTYEKVEPEELKVEELSTDTFEQNEIDLVPPSKSEARVGHTIEPQLSDDDLDRIADKEEKYGRAKELIDPDGYINSGEITLKEHIGKDVILIHFWTYGCYNCRNTLPYVTKWYDTYKDQGLLIIGVHTPEFSFEEDYDNVLDAVQRHKINYPVVQDNEKKTWRAYENRYWPRIYLIDIDGFIVYDHIGEGAYSTTEDKIKELLKEREEVLNP